MSNSLGSKNYSVLIYLLGVSNWPQLDTLVIYTSVQCIKMNWHDLLNLQELDLVIYIYYIIYLK